MKRQYHSLPKKLYKVKIPMIATYTEEEIELFGIPQDEINGKPKDASEAMTTVMINIDRMIDIYSMGYPIQLVNKDDTTEVFKALEDYLSGVINEHEFSLNKSTEVDPRMDEIDKFAQEMFGLNKATIVKNTIDVSNEFGLNINLMNEGFVEPRRDIPIKGEPTGILAAYKDKEPEQPNSIFVEKQYNFNNVYNNTPIIDLDKITRKSSNQRKRGISLKDL